MPYAPEAGDLIWTDFDPRVGREQSGRRPALVVSPANGPICVAAPEQVMVPREGFGTTVMVNVALAWQLPRVTVSV